MENNTLKSVEIDGQGQPNGSNFEQKYQELRASKVAAEAKPELVLPVTFENQRRPWPKWLRFKNIEVYRIRAGQIATNPRVKWFITVLIIINTLMMGISTYDFVQKNPPIEAAFEAIELVFLVFFTLELLLDLFYLGGDLFTDNWRIFDFGLVLGSWVLHSVQVVSSMRVVRALRLLGRGEEMRGLTVALTNSFPRLGAIGLVFIVIFYVYAVLCTTLFKEAFMVGATKGDYFGTLEKSFFTLFQMMTLSNWSDIVRELMSYYHFTGVVVGTSFVFIATYIVLNLIVAVMVDTVTENSRLALQAKQDDPDQDIKLRLMKLESLLEEIKNKK
jgi:voltage-gated sodium channel